MATDRQIEANRKNAALSSGPKTEAGKAASRANALKHGLTCETLDVEAERSPAFQARRDDWAAEYHVSSPSDEWALDRAVAASFRIERCEAAFDLVVESTSKRAKLAWDQDHELEAANLAARLAKNPSLIARKLATTWHGVNLMIRWWERLDESLTKGDHWTELEESTALDLLGIPTHLRSGRTPIDDPTNGPNLPFRQNLVLEEIIRLEVLRDNAMAHLDDLERRNAIQGRSAIFTAPAKLVLRYEREAWAQYREAVQVLTTAGPKPEVKPEPKPAPELKPEPQPVAATVDQAAAAKIEEARIELAEMLRSLDGTDFPTDRDLELFMKETAGTNPISGATGTSGGQLAASIASR